MLETTEILFRTLHDGYSRSLDNASVQTRKIQTQGDIMLCILSNPKITTFAVPFIQQTVPPTQANIKPWIIANWRET